MTPTRGRAVPSGVGPAGPPEPHSGWHPGGILDLMPRFQIAQDPAADAVLADDPFALLCGMLLDQQVPMEVAFAGPAKILERFGTLDPAAIAAADAGEFAALCAQRPAVHRFPGSMAARVQSLAAVVAQEYAGDASRIWMQARDGADLVRRLEALPGFGAAKARIFGALVGKQLGIQPAGWEEATTPYGEPGAYRSVADVVDAESLLKVRATKKAAKAAARG